jgi:predicted nucleic acid-binding protein
MKVFADTFYWIAITLPSDAWGDRVVEVCEALGTTRYVTTDEILVEFLSHLSSKGEHLRELAVQLVRRILQDEDITVIPQSRESFLRGLDLYERRLDKGYCLVDCISMNAMRDGSITAGLSNDRHFEQEGFTLLV